MGDLISRKALIEKAYDEAKGMAEPYKDFGVMVDWLAGKMPSEQQWIPCSERLPEEETDVLVCNADGKINISRGSYSTEIQNDWIWYTTGWRFGEVVAWMPFPEPYKENKT